MTTPNERDRELAEKIAAYFVESPPLNHYLQHATNIITTHLAPEREVLALALQALNQSHASLEAGELLRKQALTAIRKVSE